MWSPFKTKHVPLEVDAAAALIPSLRERLLQRRAG